jgi:RNA-binding protein
MDTKDTLSSKQRQSLKQQAHHLQPTVMVGQNGLTESIIAETDRSLNAHELIKVRVQEDDRQVREAIFKTLCDQLGAQPVQHIGKLLVLWRAKKEEK